MLNPEQREQISRQITAYENEVGVGLVKVPFGDKTLALRVDQLVASPEIMNSGVQVIQYLAQFPELVRGKRVTDMGAGSGIIGLASALLGANHVLMADIDNRAVANVEANINQLHLKGRCEVFQSDLFHNFGDRPKAEVQIFNHPFFADFPVRNKEWTQMMLGGTELLGKYFEEAPHFATSDALYILPWLTLAENNHGIDNDPGKRAMAYGFTVSRVTEQHPVKSGIQQSLFKIYELRHRV